MIDRRKFSLGVFSLFCTPAIIRTPGLIMPIKPMTLIPVPPLYPGEIDLLRGRDLAYWVTRGSIDLPARLWPTLQ